MQFDEVNRQIHLDEDDMADYDTDVTPVHEEAALFMVRTAERLLDEHTALIRDQYLSSEEGVLAAQSPEGRAALAKEERLRTNFSLLQDVVLLVKLRRHGETS